MEKKIKEVRVRELRAIDNQEEERMIVEGYAIVFNEPTDLGYIEIIESGALDNCDMSDVCMKYNHEDNVLIMARTRNNSLQLIIDDKGLRVRAELLDTNNNKDLYKMIQAGLLDKMSFAFTVSSEDVDYETNTRRITGIDKLYDVSVVDVPAYDTTEIYARNKEQFEEDFLNLSNKSGIAALDGKAEFQNVNITPIVLDESQLKRLNYNIFDYFGVNEKIIDNSFNEEEWNAFEQNGANEN